MHLDIEADYPPGTPGELAVCYIGKSETVWWFEEVADRTAAEHQLVDVLNRDDICKVIVGGRPGGVAWIAKCIGDEWTPLKPTIAAQEYFRGVWD